MRSPEPESPLGESMPWRSAGHLVAEWGLYVALAVVAHHSAWWLAVPCWVVMAWCLLGNGAVVHETTHRHLFRSRAVNRVVGVVAGATVLFPWGVYRPYHLGHHKYSVTADDPEGAVYRFTSRWVYLALPFGGVLFLGQMVWWGLRCLVGRPPSFVRGSRQRWEAGIDALVVLVALAGVVTLGWWRFDLLVDVWLVPWVITMTVLFPLVLIPEHYGAQADDAADALRSTRTIVSNRFVTWAYWCNNLHAAHHAAAAVVPQHLARLTRDAVVPAQSEQWVSSGYLRFHLDLIRHPERFDGASTR